MTLISADRKEGIPNLEIKIEDKSKERFAVKFNHP